MLITGMSGTGKSTVIKELAARDRSGLGAQQDWIWREDRIADLLSTDDADVLFLSGTASNQVKFYGRFDHIVLLTAPASVMTERLVRRTNNPYGKEPNDLARALALKETVEPLLRRGADLEIDTSVPVDEVVEKILGVVLR